MRILGIWYTNNAAPAKVLRASLESIRVAQECTRNVNVLTCPWRPIEGNPFPEILAAEPSNNHLGIVRQQLQLLWAGREWQPEAVSFLEHDVLYPRDYFERVRNGIWGKDVWGLNHCDFIGLNATGYLQSIQRDPLIYGLDMPLHQMSARYPWIQRAMEERRERCEANGWCCLEPPECVNFARTLFVGIEPAVHINHAHRFTSHGEACYEAVSSLGTVHPHWGDMGQYWAE